MKEAIRAHLSHSRELDGSRVREVIYEHFGDLVGRLWRQYSGSAASSVDAPEVMIVFSSERAPQTYSAVGVPPIVVYDQYLGQTMNHLNVVSKTAEPTVPQLATAFKILAEFFAVRAHPNAASHFALKYLELVTPVRAYLAPAMSLEVEERAAATSLQEVYALGHEVAHVILDTAEGALDDRLVWNEREHIDESVLLELNGPLVNYELQPEARRQLVIEMTCDHLATEVAFQWGQYTRLSIDPLFLIDRIWKGSLHLRWIFSIRRLATDYLQGGLPASMHQHWLFSRVRAHATEGNSYYCLGDRSDPAVQANAQRLHNHFQRSRDDFLDLHSQTLDVVLRDLRNLGPEGDAQAPRELAALYGESEAADPCDLTLRAAGWSR